jgi:hypothetical protein
VARTNIGILCLLSLLYCNNAYGLKPTLSEVMRNEEAGIIAPKQNIPPFKLPKEKSDRQINPTIAQNGRVIPNKSHPQVAKLYEGLGQKISELNFNGEDEELENKKSGIDLALRELAADFEKQFMSIMWQFASSGINTGHGFATDVFKSELNNSIVESGYNDLGEIGQNIYEELIRNVFKNEKTDGAGKRKQTSRRFAKDIPIIHAKS